MNWLDVGIIIAAVFFTVTSAVWGFIRQLIAIGGLILGVILASAFNTPVSEWLVSSHFVSEGLVARGAAFLLVVAVVSVCASAGASALFFTVGLLFMGPLDMILGAVLGFLQAVIAIAVILVGGLVAMPDTFRPAIENGVLASRLIKPLGSLVTLFAPSGLKEAINAAISTLNLP